MDLHTFPAVECFRTRLHSRIDISFPWLLSWLCRALFWLELWLSSEVMVDWMVGVGSGGAGGFRRTKVWRPDARGVAPTLALDGRTHT